MPALQEISRRWLQSEFHVGNSSHLRHKERLQWLQQELKARPSMFWLFSDYRQLIKIHEHVWLEVLKTILSFWTASTSWKPSWAQMGWIPIMGSHVSFMFTGYFTHIFRAQGIKKHHCFHSFGSKKRCEISRHFPVPTANPSSMSPHLYPRAAKQLRSLPWAEAKMWWILPSFFM